MPPYSPYRYGQGTKKFWYHFWVSEPIALYSCILGAIGLGAALLKPARTQRAIEMEQRAAFWSRGQNKAFKEF